MKADKRIIAAIWIFTALAYALVIILHELPATANPPTFVRYQPLLHALLNGTCFLMLMFSLAAVRFKNFALHKRLNTSAILLSVVFLMSYVVYHYLAGDTKYGGPYKAVYLFVLLSHIILAGLSLPFILLAYYQGFIGDLQRHRRWVKFVFPVWAYVTLTGVMVYMFLKPYYGS